MNRRGTTSILMAERGKRLIPEILIGLCVLCHCGPLIAQEEKDTAAEQPKNQLFDLKIPVTPEALRPVKFPLYPCIEERIEIAVMQGEAMGKLLKAARIADAVETEFGNAADDEMVGLVLDDETGKPVEGVLLEARYSPTGYQTKTDKNGLFHFKRQLSNVIWMNREGYGQRIIFSARQGAEKRLILLSKLTYFEGIVTDPEGQPVADALIRAICDVADERRRVTDVQTETRSNADGTYRLCVTSNRYNLQVIAPARGVAGLTGVRIWHHMERKVRIKLGKAVRFEARVIDHQTRQPVEGFVLYRNSPPQIDMRSDKQGRIVIDDLIPGPLVFQCGGGDRIQFGSAFRYEPGSFGRWWSEDATDPLQHFDPGQAAGPQSSLGPWRRNFDSLSFDLKPDMQPITILVEAGVTISGRVTDPDGHPVEGATVMAIWTGANNTLSGDNRFRASSDKQGRYQIVIPASHEAQYHLVAHDGSYDQWRQWANGISKPIQTNPGETVNNFDLQLERPGIIKGQIVQNGNPVANANVNVADDRHLEPMLSPRGTTDEEGYFEIKCVRPDKYMLYFAGRAIKGARSGISVEPGEVVDVGEWEVTRK